METDLGGTSTDRVRRFRQRQRQERTRIDGWITSSASWRLSALAAAWGVSKAGVVDRLLIEADERYRAVLFPEVGTPRS